jgi:hypothetical protein
MATDFLTFACGFNPTAPVKQVDPPGSLTQWLAGNARGERIVAVNHDWSLFRPPRALLPPNAALAYRLLDAQGYDSLLLKRYRQLAQAAQGGNDPSPPENGNLVFFKQADATTAALVAARWVLSPTPTVSPGLVSGPTLDGVNLAELRPAVPVARFVGKTIRADDRRALEEMPALATSDPRAFAHTAWLPSGTSVPLPAAAGEGAASWRIAGPGRREIQVQSAAGGLLLVAENYDPGWQATWQPASGSPVPLGVPVRVLRANVTFQAIQVPGGAGSLHLRYEPASFRAGLFLSLLGLAALAGAGAARRAVRENGAGSSQPRR